ncbi:Lipopolysaccharide modification acyltransferase [Labilithrix luteola]|uniref:Lipopolysaccharide modification acyltransferase n=1 Tax=Labilithrix luteola TaxID=1391654 RepID=A0A0K1Q455_9BACT|nr:acyltransferase family protein [Labilithrix luteola]AKV00533.1 Lipopolysaccharide modification acyltransferase [Labilithrix luteola]
MRASPASPTGARHARQARHVRHVPALDGLRGIALLGVLFFHANGALPGGYLGVDLFFVLSGYLITSLLLAEHRDAGRIALGAFWVRRAKRLFPALISLMPAIAVYGRYFAKADEIRGLRVDAVATLAYVANWRAIFSHKSYWELFAAPSPLEHTWSLSIEEQFYVVWPLLVVVLLRFWSARAVRVVSVGLALASMAAMWLLFDPQQASRVYLGTDTRAVGILAGAALATVVSPNTTFGPRAARVLDALGFVSLAGLGFAWVMLEGQNPLLYRGGFWLTEVGVLILIVCAVVGERSYVARALTFRPFVWVGTISYGLYLWHWPVNVVLTADRMHLHGLGLHAVQFAVTFAIAIISYRYLEQPIRRGVGFGRPSYMVPASIALAIGLVMTATQARALEEPHGPNANALDTNAATDVTTAAEWSPFRVLMLGDSTANSLGWALRSVHKPGVAVDLRGLDGCTMLIDSCGGPEWAQRTTEFQPHVTVVFLGGAFMHGTSADGDWRKACYPDWDEKFEHNLETRLSDLTAAGGHVWASTVPYPLGAWETTAIHKEVDCINQSIRKAVSSVPGARILDIAERLCPQGKCERTDGKAVIRPDGVHYSVDGAASLARWVFEQLQH